MRLKPGVQIVEQTLCTESEKKDINEGDSWIFNELVNGTEDENTFIELVMRNEKANEMNASFRMAMFVEEYSAFLSDDNHHRVIQ